MDGTGLELELELELELSVEEGRKIGLDGLLHTGSSVHAGASLGVFLGAGCLQWEGKGRVGGVCVFARIGNGFVHGTLSVFVSLNTA
jgi:hypothetical protein